MTAGGTPAAAPPRERSPRLATFLVVAAAVGISLFHYARTLGLAYFADDVDYLNLVATVFSGERSYLSYLFYPAGEHVIPITRMAFHASAKLFGVDAWPFRLLSILTHAAAGALLGVAARRVAGPVAGIATAIAYTLPVGFASLWMWHLNGFSVPVAVAFYMGAVALLVAHRPPRASRGRALAFAATTLAVLADGTFFPLVAVPALCDEVLRRRDGERGLVGRFAVACGALALASVALSSWLYRRLHEVGMEIDFERGLPAALFLVVVAPFRLFFPGIPVAPGLDPGLPTLGVGALRGLLVLSPMVAGALLLWRRGVPLLVRLAAATVVGPLGILALAGLGRASNSFPELYDADRYFSALLIPFALFVGAAAARFEETAAAWPRKARAAFASAVAALVLVEAWLHGSALENRIPAAAIAVQGRRFQQLDLLARRVAEAAARTPALAGPLLVPKGPIIFPDLHNGAFSTDLLVALVRRRGATNVRLGARTIDAARGAWLDPVFDAWAREIGERVPYVRVEEGRLKNRHLVSLVDFARAPFDEAVGAGFHPWETSFRWMEKRGTLQLTMTSSTLVVSAAAPVAALRKARPGWDRVTLSATLVDETSGFEVPLGERPVAEEGVQALHFPASAFQARFGLGRKVRVVLTSDTVWRPSELIPGSKDARTLSVAVSHVGFFGGPWD